MREYYVYIMMNNAGTLHVGVGFDKGKEDRPDRAVEPLLGRTIRHMALASQTIRFGG